MNLNLVVYFFIFSVSLKFLLDVADMVDDLTVTIKESNSNSRLKLVKDILSRRCSELEINYWSNSFSVSDIVNLVAVSFVF